MKKLEKLYKPMVIKDIKVAFKGFLFSKPQVPMG